MMSFSRLVSVWFAIVLTTLLASCGGGSSKVAESGNSAANYVAATLTAGYVEPKTGWYWNPAEGGRGFAVERQGNQLFLAGFFYEVNGAATWAVSTLTLQSDGQYTGELLRYSGGQALLGAYQSAAPSKLADVSMAFTTTAAGTLRVAPATGEAPVSIALQAFPISTPTAFALSNASFDNGWWWNVAEPGRGYFIEVQGSQAFVGSFMYDDSGQPTWYVSDMTLQDPLTVSGTLDQYTNGQSLLGSYRSATKTSTSPGTMSFQLTSANTGNLVLPNNAKVAINRFVFNAVPPLKNLLISEVSNVYYSNDVAWLEVYNPNSVAVSLANYSLRSGSMDTVTNTGSTTPINFNLPALEVPANGYMVIAGKVYSNLLNNSQIVYVGSANKVPFWTNGGAVELVSNGQTADFVRFGPSAVTPLTAGHWSGSSAQALPFGINEHGKSIVRLASGGMADSNTAADWTLVNFATPAGANDVAAGVVDSDNDGIPDSAKVPGGTYGGLDLYAMGARPGRRDAFIEIDYMGGADPALTPRQEALQKLTDTFAAKNIALHLDVGNLYSANFNPGLFNLGGGNAVPFATCIDSITTFSGTTTVGCTSLYSYKSANFDVRRKLVFHYALFGNSQSASGSCGSSGVAEFRGNNLAITLGSCGFTNAAGSMLNQLVNAQAGTLMHEFGHNLGLDHGGNQSNNYKPNYYSVMNYLYSFTGLSQFPGAASAANRYYLHYKLKGWTTPCALDNSPCSTAFIMDYSNGSSADLDENNLQESANIGRGSTNGAYADWNNDGVLTNGPVVRNIHSADTSYGFGILKDYNDWANLSFPFARGYPGSNAGASPLEVTPVQRVNPMNERPRKVIVEDPLPQHIQQMLHQRRNELP